MKNVKKTKHISLYTIPLFNLYSSKNTNIYSFVLNLSFHKFFFFFLKRRSNQWNISIKRLIHTISFCKMFYSSHLVVIPMTLKVERIVKITNLKTLLLERIFDLKLWSNWILLFLILLISLLLVVQTEKIILFALVSIGVPTEVSKLFYCAPLSHTTSLPTKPFLFESCCPRYHKTYY